MRILRLTLAMAGSLALGGCFQSTIVMKINADGSGTLEETVAVTKAGLAQMRQFASLGGSRGAAQALSDPFSDEQARGATAAIGPGVTFVGSRPVQTAAGEGRAITYAFKDVRQIGAGRQPSMPGDQLGGGTAGRQDVRFEVVRLPNGNAVLTIRLPEPTLPSAPGPGGIDGVPVDALPRQFPIEQLGVMKQLFVGAKLAIAVEPNGRVVKSTSPFVEGRTVTLLDLDFNQLMDNDAVFARLGGVHSLEDAQAATANVPGLRIHIERQISIEFTPDQ